MNLKKAKQQAIRNEVQRANNERDKIRQDSQKKQEENTKKFNEKQIEEIKKLNRCNNRTIQNDNRYNFKANLISKLRNKKSLSKRAKVDKIS